MNYCDVPLEATDDSVYCIGGILNKRRRTGEVAVALLTKADGWAHRWVSLLRAWRRAQHSRVGISVLRLWSDCPRRDRNSILPPYGTEVCRYDLSNGYLHYCLVFLIS